MAQAAPHPRMHGIIHNPGGADPIPGMPPNPGAPGSYLGRYADTDCLAFWRFNELTGNSIDQAASPFQDNVSLATPPNAYSTRGVAGPAQLAGSLAFRLTTDTIDANAPVHEPFLHDAGLFNATNPWTYMVWIRPNGSQNDVALITERGNLYSDGLRNRISISALKVYTVRGDGTRIDAPSSLTSGTWYHVGATYNGTTLVLYVNGVAVASTASAGSATSYRNLRFMRNFDVSNAAEHSFIGDFCDMAVFKRAMTATEMAGFAAGETAAGAGWVLTSDGTGGMVWVPPPTLTVTVNGA